MDIYPELLILKISFKFEEVLLPLMYLNLKNHIKSVFKSVINSSHSILHYYA